MSDWEIRNDNFDKDALLATIYNTGTSFLVLYDNPHLFKYMNDAWYIRHKRTIEDLFNAMDIPYSPLENYDRHANILSSTNDKGQSTSLSSTKDSYIGSDIRDINDNRENTGKEVYNENGSYDTIENNSSKGNKNISEDGTSKDVSVENTSEVNNGNSSEASLRDYDESDLITKDTDTASMKKTKTDTTNHTWDNSKSYVEDVNKTQETLVSAYNDGYSGGSGNSSSDPDIRDGYSPSELVINNGKTKTVHEDGTGNNDGVITTNTGDADKNYEDYTATSSEMDSEAKEGKENIAKTTSSTDNKNIDNQKLVDGATTHNSNEDSSDESTSHTHNDDSRSNDTSRIDHSTGNTNEIGKQEHENKSVNSNESTNLNDRDYKSVEYTHGNIGVTTSQQMLEAQIKVRAYDLYKVIANMYVDEMCIRIYLSPKQRGGCCCDY